MVEYIKCETCLYNKNCQFLAKHKNVVVEGCSAYKNAADVVEVVRCKDCKYFDQYSYLYSDEPSGFGKCEKIHMDIDLTIDDFCSYGERRC